MHSPYLLNCWYVAAWSSELAPGTFMRRVLLDTPILLMRDDTNHAAAMSNICPHRFASLSEGKFVRGVVECPYHGLRFDMTGHCVLNPHGDGTIPDRARVRAYTIEERYGAIWIWPGDPQIADVASIPDFSFLDEPIEQERAGGHLLTAANYQLMADNIMDLSHADFVHPTSLGTEGETARSHAKVRTADDVVTIKWSFEGKGIVMNRAADHPRDVRTDLEVTWYLPGAMTLRSESAPLDCDDIGHKRIAAHIMTPETLNSTHYFFDVVDRRNLEKVIRIFRDEDGVILEQIHQNMRGRDFWDLGPAVLSNDRGAILARRILQRKIRDEQSGGK